MENLGELPAFLIAWSMHLEYAFCSALSMRSFVQYVQFLLNQTNNNNSTMNPTELNNQSTSYLIPYLYSSYSSLTKESNNQITSTFQIDDAHHLHHHHLKLTPVPNNTKDDLQTSGFLVLLFLIVFLLKSRGIKVSNVDFFLKKGSYNN